MKLVFEVAPLACLVCGRTCEPTVTSVQYQRTEDPDRPYQVLAVSPPAGWLFFGSSQSAPNHSAVLCPDHRDRARPMSHIERFLP